MICFDVGYVLRLAVRGGAGGGGERRIPDVAFIHIAISLGEVMGIGVTTLCSCRGGGGEGGVAVDIYFSFFFSSSLSLTPFYVFFFSVGCTCEYTSGCTCIVGWVRLHCCVACCQRRENNTGKRMECFSCSFSSRVRATYKCTPQQPHAHYSISLWHPG